MEIVKLQGRRRDVSTFVDPLLHQLQPPGSRVQRLGELPHLLLLRQRLQADPPQTGQGVARLAKSDKAPRSQRKPHNQRNQIDFRTAALKSFFVQFSQNPQIS